VPDRATGELKRAGTVGDLVFGSNSQLRTLAEVYACSDSQKMLVRDFMAAWNKVMNLDRFDSASSKQIERRGLIWRRYDLAQAWHRMDRHRVYREQIKAGENPLVGYSTLEAIKSLMSRRIFLS
jgi:hypothetical protein